MTEPTVRAVIGLKSGTEVAIKLTESALEEITASIGDAFLDLTDEHGQRWRIQTGAVEFIRTARPRTMHA